MGIEVGMGAAHRDEHEYGHRNMHGASYGLGRWGGSENRHVVIMRGGLEN